MKKKLRLTGKFPSVWIRTGIWHHLAWSNDGMYLDGKLVATSKLVKEGR